MYTYYFKEPLGPTEINLSLMMKTLGWKCSKEKANFSNDNLMSDKQLACFEYKHQLHYWLLKHKLNFSPKTVVLDELSLHSTLAALAKDNWECAWILKPALLNNGQGLQIFSDLSQVDAYFKQTDRYSGMHVLQRYINSPWLVDNRKFSLRMFVVLNRGKGVYVHPNGYINVCQAPYQPNEFSHLESHLTNEHLNADGAVNNQQVLTSDWPLFDKIFAEVERQCQALFTPFITEKLDFNTYGILGVDFMLDINQRLWLLEVNHGPCFPTSSKHPLFQSLYQPFWFKVVNGLYPMDMEMHVFRL